MNFSLHLSLTDPPPQDRKPGGSTFKRAHYVFCVHGSPPGDCMLEQFVHFLGKKKKKVEGFEKLSAFLVGITFH